jgi:hypothetical protein
VADFAREARTYAREARPLRIIVPDQLDIGDVIRRLTEVLEN